MSGKSVVCMQNSITFGRQFKRAGQVLRQHHSSGSGQRFTGRMQCPKLTFQACSTHPASQFSGDQVWHFKARLRKGQSRQLLSSNQLKKQCAEELDDVNERNTQGTKNWRDLLVTISSSHLGKHLKDSLTPGQEISKFDNRLGILLRWKITGNRVSCKCNSGLP